MPKCRIAQKNAHFGSERNLKENGAIAEHTCQACTFWHHFVTECSTFLEKVHSAVVKCAFWIEGDWKKNGAIAEYYGILW